MNTPLQPAVGTDWSFLPVDEFQHYAAEWQKLVEVHYAAHPLLDVKFVGPLVETFAGDDVSLAVERRDGEVAGMSLLEPVRRGMVKVFSPSQSPLCLLLTRRQEDYGVAVRRLFQSMPQFTWSVELKQYDSAYCGPLAACGRVVERIVHGETMAVRIEDDFEHYWQARSRNLRKNIGRYFRRAEKEGFEVRLTVLADVADMALGVAGYGDLESTGWKGEQGTAIHAGNRQGRFYTQVMENFAHTGGGRIYNLHFNEQLVASRLTLVQNGMLVILKTTYDEQFAKYAPGRLLLYRILQTLFAEHDVRVVEFYTRASGDQLQWATDRRMIHHVNLYRSPVMVRMVAMARALRRLSGRG
jgi:hypothetical protein